MPVRLIAATSRILWPLSRSQYNYFSIANMPYNNPSPRLRHIEAQELAEMIRAEPGPADQRSFAIIDVRDDGAYLA